MATETSTKVVEVRSVIADTYRVIWGKPLDYSFKELTCIADTLDEEPKEGIKKKVEHIETTLDTFKKGIKVKTNGEQDASVDDSTTSTVNAVQPENVAAPETKEGGGEDKSAAKRIIRTTSIKMNNNYIEAIEQFDETMAELFVHPLMLTWIDLSFNNIKSISVDFSKYEQLGVLYLHGNELCKVAEVNKVFEAKTLKKLTLHGNGIENMPGYRYYVISHMPNLKELDFCGVTKQEKALGVSWCQQNAGKRMKKSYT